MIDIACHGQHWIYSILLQPGTTVSIFPYTDRSTANMGINAGKAAGLSPPASTAVRLVGKIQPLYPRMSLSSRPRKRKIMSDIWALTGGISQRSHSGLNVYSGCSVPCCCDSNSKAGGELSVQIKTRGVVSAGRAGGNDSAFEFSDDAMIVKWPRFRRRGHRWQ